MRKSGILMPVFSLPSPYGIGSLGKEAYGFIDFLYEGGQSLWQVLPLNPTGYGDSPYSSFSVNAGNPYFIDLELLEKDGLIKKADFVNVDFGKDKYKIDYGKLYENRYKILKLAFENFDLNDKNYLEFVKAEDGWLFDYSLFMTIKDSEGGKSWTTWSDAELKFRNKTALENFSKKHKAEIDFYKFLQYEFYKQWFELKKYANLKGIEIIGDMPIYVAYDSVDVWANTNQFDLDENLLPKVVSGCPPDAFSDDGQLWGTPVYKWQDMKAEKEPYSWWRKRVEKALKIYNIIRIDHFRGFEAFYCIKYGNKNAKGGKWRKGPGISLFKYLEKDYGNKLPIIAEDLGYLTDGVKRLLKNTGFCGMKVLQFAFDGEPDNLYLPHNHIKNCVVYTGTHDNDTLMGWKKNGDKTQVENCKKYLDIADNEPFNWAIMKSALSSVADTVILCMQDFIGLESDARINSPSTTLNNWTWRIDGGCLNSWLSGIILENTKMYGRFKNK